MSFICFPDRARKSSLLFALVRHNGTSMCCLELYPVSDPIPCRQLQRKLVLIGPFRYQLLRLKVVRHSLWMEWIELDRFQFPQCDRNSPSISLSPQTWTSIFLPCTCPEWCPTPFSPDPVRIVRALLFQRVERDHNKVPPSLFCQKWMRMNEKNEWTQNPNRGLDLKIWKELAHRQIPCCNKERYELQETGKYIKFSLRGILFPFYQLK